ncbi:membrane protein [Actinoplanes italicus]|uniref:Putative transmembrane protein PGPGW n=1 Tax=Actinoplanes italicus TaxID=113567 RepID=A0A2T0K0M9_9ACTN|nr:PGPGW domain-containing protein [Actinoplanes italicus]PRX16130.1 putative transmembrane protein PGPGW [Actinoplanes italicus]GIE32112.1 membrane protein [Actinoplanes italicus]
MTTDWHIDPGLIEQYENGTLVPSRVMAVEAHMLSCAACRALIPAEDAWLDDSWSAVYDELHAPRVGPVARLLTRAGLPGHRLRLLTATPALRWSWVLATSAVLTLAVAAAWFGREGSQAIGQAFLALAPILPVIAVSGAYGPPADPMHEITGTTPAAGPGLVLWRAVSVIGVAVVMAGVAAVLLPGPGWYAAAWLLPALLLSTGTLALATSLTLPVAAVVLGALWLTGVLVVARTAEGLFVSSVFGPTAQLAYLLAAAVFAAVLITRRRRFDLGESR